MATVKREEFLRRLEMVQPGLATREIVEQSACFVLQAKEVQAFNDEVYCRAPSGLDKTFKGAVPAKKLLDLLHKLKEDEVDVEQTNGELIVRGKSKSAHFRTEAEITLPVDAVEKPEEGSWQALPPDFLHALDIVQVCAGTDASEPATVCVHITPKWIEAFHRFQVGRYKIKTGFSQNRLVRRDSIKHVVTLGMTEFAETDGWVHFRNGELTLSCRQMFEDYKDLALFLEVEGGKPASFPKGLEEVAERAEVFSMENQDENLLEVSLRPGKVTVRGMGITGWYRETKKLHYDGPPIQFLIAPKMLVEMATKHNEVLVSDTRLKVTGEKWCYVAALGKPRQEEEENGK